MKKRMICVLIAVMLLTAAMLPVCAAETVISGNFEYKLLSSGNFMVTGYNGSGNVVEIPSEVDGRPVVSISDDTFKDNTDITGVIFPDTLKCIGQSAFAGCTALTSVEIPDSVTVICNFAFRDCTSLADIKLSDNLTWLCTDVFENTAYYNDPANWDGEALYIGRCLVDVEKDVSGFEVKPGTTLIGDNAFDGCNGLTAVCIPDSVIAVGWQAFKDCAALERLVIPDGVESIGDYAFENCTALEQLVVPDSVSSIEVRAFAGAKKVTLICGKDSFAAKYAVKYGIAVKYTDCDEGDMDGSGKIDINDLMALKVAILAGYDDKQLIIGDMDKNGELNVNDMTALKTKIMSE